MTEKKEFNPKQSEHVRIKELPKIESYYLNRHIVNALNEVYGCYASGFNRSTSVISFAIIEYLYKNIFYPEESKKEKTVIKTLFERSFKQGFFSLEDYNLLKAFSEARNSYIHDISRDVKDKDVKLLLLIMIKILNAEKQTVLLS